MSSDIRTKALVLRRTNYGESDRILHLLTESGTVSAIAHSARKEKSKLAGGIEMFCLSEVTIKNNKKNATGYITSAKMLKYYHNILADLSRLELASFVLKQIWRVAENDAGSGYFNITNQSLAGIDAGFELPLVEAWFLLNFAKTNGEEINLVYDNSGKKLQQDKLYAWNTIDNALELQEQGNIDANDIKLMRLMLSASLELVCHVKDLSCHLPNILYIAKSVNKL